MRLKKLKFPFLKLPANIELILYLLKEELKNNRLISGLEKAGLEDCYFQSHFGGLVLTYAGFDDVPDDLYEFYYKLIEKYAEKIESDNDVIVECAFNVYIDLMIEKKRRLLQR